MTTKSTGGCPEAEVTVQDHAETKPRRRQRADRQPRRTQATRCRGCGQALGIVEGSCGLVLSLHLRQSRFCRAVYADHDHQALIDTLHVRPQGGYLHWSVWGVTVSGDFKKVGDFHLKAEAEREIERRRCAMGAGEKK